MRSDQSGRSRATGSKASISRSNPFWEFSRPAATTTGASSFARPPGIAGTAFGMRSTRRPGSRSA